MIENNMILTDEMKRRIKEEYERLQKERVEAVEDLVSQELDKAELETKNAKAMATALNYSFRRMLCQD